MSFQAPLFVLFLACLIFSLCLTLHFLKIDCSLAKDTSFLPIGISSLFMMMMMITNGGGGDGTTAWNESCSTKKPKKPPKKLHWLAPDLKGKSANIEISISEQLDYRALTGKIEPLQSKKKVNKHPGRQCSPHCLIHFPVLLCIGFYEVQKKKRKLKL